MHVSTVKCKHITAPKYHSFNAKSNFHIVWTHGIIKSGLSIDIVHRLVS